VAKEVAGRSRSITALADTATAKPLQSQCGAPISENQLPNMSFCIGGENDLTIKFDYPVCALWWDKLLNVQEVIDVGGRASTPVGRTEGISDALRIICDAGDLTSKGGQADFFCSLYYCQLILFGGVHCFVWSFPFPIGGEKVL